MGFKDETPEVRTAAYNTLLDFKDDEAITQYLLATVNKEGRRAANSPLTVPMLAVLLSSSLPDVERQVTTLLDQQAGTRDGLLLVTSLADEIGDHGRLEDVPLLKKLSDLHAFSQEFGLRRAVSKACRRSTSKNRSAC